MRWVFLGLVGLVLAGGTALAQPIDGRLKTVRETATLRLAYRIDSPAIIEAQTAARQAFGQTNVQAPGTESPLQAEEALNLARWGYLDQLEAGHYFDIDKLVVYVLRLQLLERKARFDEQKGREMFDLVYGEITRPIGDIVHGKA